MTDTAAPPGPPAPPAPPAPPQPAASAAAPAIDPRIAERREAVERQHGRRRLRWAGALVVVVVVGFGAYAGLHSGLVAVRAVRVYGAPPAGVGAVVGAAGLGSHPPLIDVDPSRVAARVEALPWVAGATVARDWPDAVTVTVTVRRPAVVVARPAGGDALVDITGRVVGLVTRPPAGVAVLGAPAAPGPPGTVLARPDAPGLTVLGAFPASLRARVLGVDVASGGAVTVALTGGIEVALGPAVDLSAKFDALRTVLEDAPPPAPALIDVTVPDAPAVGPPVAPARRATPVRPPVVRHPTRRAGDRGPF